MRDRERRRRRLKAVADRAWRAERAVRRLLEERSWPEPRALVVTGENANAAAVLTKFAGAQVHRHDLARLSLEELEELATALERYAVGVLERLG